MLILREVSLSSHSGHMNGSSLIALDFGMSLNNGRLIIQENDERGAVGPYFFSGYFEINNDRSAKSVVWGVGSDGKMTSSVISGAAATVVPSQNGPIPLTVTAPIPGSATSTNSPQPAGISDTANTHTSSSKTLIAAVATVSSFLVFLLALATILCFRRRRRRTYSKRASQQADSSLTSFFPPTPKSFLRSSHDNKLCDIPPLPSTRALEKDVPLTPCYRYDKARQYPPSPAAAARSGSEASRGKRMASSVYTRNWYADAEPVGGVSEQQARSGQELGGAVGGQEIYAFLGYELPSRTSTVKAGTLSPTRRSSGVLGEYEGGGFRLENVGEGDGDEKEKENEMGVWL